VQKRRCQNYRRQSGGAELDAGLVIAVGVKSYTHVLGVTWSAWAQPTTAVAGTTGKGAALASSLDLRGISKPLWWRARQVRTLLWPLFDRSAWAQPPTVEAGTTVEGGALAPVFLVGVG
jgi:hypothetical protein